MHARAKYIFAACLSASVLDLVLVDFVVGPSALRPEGAFADAAPSPLAAPTSDASSDSSSVAAEAPQRAELPVASATSMAPATAVAEAGAADALDAGLARASRPRARVVARFESDLPTANDDDLRALAAEMLADPTAEVVVEGHTDQRGDPDRNRTLSLERATWARNRLVELGVSPSRIAVVGLGAERPLHTGDEDAAVASNRRVEVRWMSGGPSPIRVDGDW